MAAPANGARYWLVAESDGGRRDDDRVGQSARLLEHGDVAGDRGLLLPDGDVDRVQRTVAGIAGGFGGTIQVRLADDRVDADRRLAGRSVADDQLALPAANRDHRVDRHDAGLDWLTHRTAADDSGRELLDRIRHRARHRPLAVERLAERVHDASEQALADRDLEQPSGRADFIAFLQLGVVTEHDDADLGLIEVQRKAGDATTEVEHLVEHRVRESLDPRDAVADLADDADTLAGRRRFGARDLGLDLLKQLRHYVSHGSSQ